MQIKALRPLRGAYGSVNADQQFDAAPATAKSLIDRGLAVAVKDAPRSAKPEAVDNKAAKAPLDGSRTGGGRRRSSSPPAPRPGG